jgi:nucleotide-binding universal stress UspA family protein
MASARASVPTSIPPAEEASRAAREPGAANPLRVLVGFDGGSGSRDALAFAKALCEATSAELNVASVRPYWSDLLGPDDFALAIKEDEHWIRRGAAEILDTLPFSPRVVADGHETGGLKELAAAERADLIVVGSSHRGQVGRVFPGSVGERVLSDAPCAVAVAPHGLADRELRFGTIAVGYDGSRESGVALGTAIELAERTGASLRILGVVDMDVVLGFEEAEPEEARVRRHLDHALERMPRSVTADARLLHGAPGHAILEAAEDADLLVIGSRGRYGEARHLLLGSVAARAMRCAPCPTLVTPAG